MYPQSPTLQQWRAVAADRARSRGITVPAWFKGADADAIRLSQEDASTLREVRNEQQRYVLENQDQFPAAFITSAKNYLGSAAVDADLSKQDYGLVDMGKDFVDEVGNQAADLNDSLNPFSAKNRRILFWGAGLVAAAYVLLPVIVRTVAGAKGAPRSARSK